MKKMILCLSVAVSAVMVSCGGGGVDADADKMCDIYKKMEKAKEAKNVEELMSIVKEFKEVGNEIQEKYKTDRDAQVKIADRIKECSGMGE